MKKISIAVLAALALGFLVMFFTTFPIGWYVCSQHQVQSLTTNEIFLLGLLSCLLVALGMAAGARLGYRWAQKVQAQKDKEQR